MIFFEVGENVVELIGEILRITVQDSQPVDSFNVLELAEQVAQAGPAVEVDTVICHILSNQDQLPHAVCRELLGLGNDHLDRFGDMLAAHERDGTERTVAVAAFRNLEIGEVPGCDSEPGPVILGLDWRGPEEPTLLRKPAQQPVGDPDNFFATEDSHDVVDIGKPFEQCVFLAFCEATGDHDSLHVPQPLAIDHLLDDADRFPACAFDEPAGVHDHEVGRVGFGHDRIASLGEQSQHAFGVHEVFGTPQADKRYRGRLRHGDSGEASWGANRPGGLRVNDSGRTKQFTLAIRGPQRQAMNTGRQGS